MEITEDQLATDWTLTRLEKSFVLKHSRKISTSLWFAAELCSLRSKGSFIENKNRAPLVVFNYLSLQLGYGRVTTVPQFARRDSESYDKISSFLGYKAFDTSEKKGLGQWLDQDVVHSIHNRSSIYTSIKSYFRSRKVILPSSIALGKIVSKHMRESYNRFYEEITESLSETNLEKIDKLLSSENEDMYNSLSLLRRGVPAASARVMSEYLEHYNYLKDIGIFDIELKLPPEIIDQLSKSCSYQNFYDLRRIANRKKRYSMIICFLYESGKDLLDVLVQMHGQMMGMIRRKSVNEVKKQRIRLAKESKTHLKLAGEFIREALLEKEKTIQLSEFMKKFDDKSLLESATACENIEAMEDSGLIKQIASRYGYLRRYSKEFIKLDFEAKGETRGIIKDIAILRQYNEGKIKSIPKNVSTKFLSESWKKMCRDKKGDIRTRYWEIGIYFTMKKLLSSGDLYLSKSKNHRCFWDFVYSEDLVQSESIMNYKESGFPGNFNDIKDNLTRQFEEVVKSASKKICDNSFASVINGELVLSKDDALYISPEVKRLRKKIKSGLPLVRIEELLSTVDNMCNFTQAFKPFDGESRNRAIPKLAIYGAIIAHATNIGLYGMGHSAIGITTEMIKYASQIYIRPETIDAANMIIINNHLKSPMSEIFGDGTWSSSDGQRYGIEKSSINASYYPRYFGYYNKSISIYTHLADCYDVFSTQVISCTEREATYVLSGLLSNKSDVTPEFHCTDTHGFTEHIFALCFLLGFSFHPRIKDLSEQKIYKIGSKSCGLLEDLFRDKISQREFDIVEDSWDQIVRIAFSIGNSHLPAHVIIQKLANRNDVVAKSIKILGRIIKTIYILKYISDKDLRYKVHLQLNRGESRHSLAKALFFVNRGLFKTSDYEEIMSKASCLSLLSNGILLWNSRQIEKIVCQLSREGEEVRDEDLQKVSPLSFRHIQLHGTYHFENL